MIKRHFISQFLLLLFVISHVCEGASADAPFKYGQIFKKTIYDQSRIMTRLESASDDSERKTIVEAELLRRKKEEVKRFIRNVIVERKRWYEGQKRSIEIDLKAKAASNSSNQKYIDRGNRWGTLGRYFCDNENEITKKITGDALVSAATNQIISIRGDMQRYNFYSEFMVKDENLKEPFIWDYEITYLLRKRFMQPSVQKEIEEILLYARSGSLNDSLREKLTLLLDIPFLIKENVTVGSNLAAELMALKQAFMNYDDLKSSPEPLRKRLWSEVVRDLAMTTLDSAGSSTTLKASPSRLCSYFYGPPGTGKSYTAKKIADFLGWPSNVPTLLTESDFSRSTLYGTEFDPGIILSMFTKLPSGKKYLNGILILDDFDRLLLGDNAAHATAALSFLQSFLDRNLNEISSNYLHGKFDISRVSIIITGNSDLERACAMRGGEYEALLSRLKVVRFNEPSKNDLYNTLVPSIDKLIAERRITNAADVTKLKKLIKNYLINGDCCGGDFRAALDKHILSIINAFLESQADAMRVYGERARVRRRAPAESAGAGAGAGAGASSSSVKKKVTEKKVDSVVKKKPGQVNIKLKITDEMVVTYILSVCTVLAMKLFGVI